MTNAQVVVFTDMLDTALIENSVVPSIARGEYKAGSSIVRGASVDVLGTEDITIGQYSGTITHQTLAGTKQVVAIDKAPYFSVKLDGVSDLATAPANLKTFVTGKSGKTLALDVDKKFVLLASKAKVTVSGTKADIGSVIAGITAELKKANVARGDMAVILDADTENLLIEQQGKAIGGDNAGSIVYDGFIGKYQGALIFGSNQLPRTGTVQTVLGLDMSALTFPRNYDEMRDIEDASFFGIAVQGILSYGIDVIETETGKSNRIVNGEVDFA